MDWHDATERGVTCQQVELSLLINHTTLDVKVKERPVIQLNADINTFQQITFEVIVKVA